MTHYHLMENEELVELAKSATFAGSLSAELAVRFEQTLALEEELEQANSRANDLEEQLREKENGTA